MLGYFFFLFPSFFPLLVSWRFFSTRDSHRSFSKGGSATVSLVLKGCAKPRVIYRLTITDALPWWVWCGGRQGLICEPSESDRMHSVLLPLRSTLSSTVSWHPPPLFPWNWSYQCSHPMFLFNLPLMGLYTCVRLPPRTFWLLLLTFLSGLIFLCLCLMC